MYALARRPIVPRHTLRFVRRQWRRHARRRVAALAVALVLTMLASGLALLGPGAGTALAATMQDAGGATYFAYPAGGAPAGTTSCPQTSDAAQQCSLAQALDLAGPGDTVVLAVAGNQAVYSGHFQVNTAGTAPDQPLTIAPAPGVTNPILDGGNSGTVLTIAAGVTVVAQGLTIQHGLAGYVGSLCFWGATAGGGISNAGTLTLQGVTLTNNQGLDSGYIGEGGFGVGGAIYNTGALTITASTLSDNDAGHSNAGSSGDVGLQGMGGAIYNTGTLSVSGSTFTDNFADSYGGAISTGDSTSCELGPAPSGRATITDTTFSNNTALNGGAISNGSTGGHGALTITASTFAQNGYDPLGDPLARHGGAIDNGDNGQGSLSVSTSSFLSNTAWQSGSAIDNAFDGGQGSLSVSTSTFAGNVMYTGPGTGAIFPSGTIANGPQPLTVTSSTFVGNGPGYGFVIAIDSNGPLTLAADILAESQNGPNCQGSGAITDAGYNVDDDGTCGLSSTNHSISDSAAIDGYLGPLSDHGGPTLTIPLLGASSVPTITAPDPAFAAIPAGFTAPGSSTPVCAQPDQRGQPRHAPCDMGAFELPPSTITLSSSANPAVSGQPITLTATISPTPDGGTVAFGDSALPAFLCRAVPVDPTTGTATCSLTYSALSDYPITATFSGAAAVAPATSAVLTQTVIKADSAVTVSASANPVAAGQPVTYTATVSARAPGSGDPGGGTLTFMDGAAPIPGCDILLNGLYALTCTTTYTTASSHAITVVYSGDADFNPSTSDVLTETVSKAPTTLALTSSANPVVYGQPLTLTATISTTGTATGLGTPSGTVTFQDGGSSISGCASQPVDPTTGTATCSTSALGAGSHSLTASYSGDGSFAASDDSAAPDSLTVSQAPQTVTFTSTPPTPALVGASYAVAATGGASGNPVTFSAAPASVCTSGGTNGATISFVGAGTCTVTASQAGNPNCQAAPGVTQSFPVASPLTLALAVSSSPPGPVTTGSTVTASFTLANHRAQAQTVTLAVALSYQGSQGSFSHTWTLRFPMKAGQTLTSSISFTIQSWFPRGMYTLRATATDTSGDAASSSATLNVS